MTKHFLTEPQSRSVSMLANYISVPAAHYIYLCYIIS